MTYNTSIDYNSIEDIYVTIYAYKKYSNLINELEKYEYKIRVIDDIKYTISILEQSSRPNVIILTYYDVDKYKITIDQVKSLLDRRNILIVDNYLYKDITMLIDYNINILVDINSTDYIVMIKNIDNSVYHLYFIDSMDTSVDVAKFLADVIKKTNYDILNSQCTDLLRIISVSRSFYPYGILNVDHQFYRYICESMPNNDAFYIVAGTEIIPGRYLGWQDSNGNKWWSDRLINTYYLTDPNLNLYDAEPSTDYSAGNSITVVLSIPPAIVLPSWNYGHSDIDYVDWQGSIGLEVAKWTHELGSGYWSGYPSGTDEIVFAKPGFSFTTVTGQNATMQWKIDGTWSSPGYRGRPSGFFTGTLIVYFTIYYSN